MGSKLHDKIAIELSDPKTSCDWFVRKIDSSTSHQSASSSFHLLRIMLMTSSIIDQLCLDNKYFVNILINKQSFLSVIEKFLQVKVVFNVFYFILVFIIVYLSYQIGFLVALRKSLQSLLIMYFFTNIICMKFPNFYSTSMSLIYIW